MYTNNYKFLRITSFASCAQNSNATIISLSGTLKDCENNAASEISMSSSEAFALNNALNLRPSGVYSMSLASSSVGNWTLAIGTDGSAKNPDIYSVTNPIVLSGGNLSVNINEKRTHLTGTYTNNTSSAGSFSEIGYFVRASTESSFRKAVLVARVTFPTVTVQPGETFVFDMYYDY